MAHVQHIAIRTNDPGKLAKYYQDVFGWKRIRGGGGGSVHLSDGHINIAVLNSNGGPCGVEHFGVKIETPDEVKEGLAKYATGTKASPGGRAAEHRLSDPDGNQIDLSVQGFMQEGEV